METLTPRRRWRRTVVGGATAAAAVVLFASVAWACTQRVGTLVVCDGATLSYVYGPGCAKITGTSQAGAVGDGVNYPKLGDEIAVKAKNFKSKPYSVTFRQAGSTSDCHRPTVGSGTTLLTATAGTGGGTKFMGPIFKKHFVIPAVGNTTGAAKICAQDVPDVVTGQVIDFTLI